MMVIGTSNSITKQCIVKMWPHQLMTVVPAVPVAIVRWIPCSRSAHLIAICNHLAAFPLTSLFRSWQCRSQMVIPWLQGAVTSLVANLQCYDHGLSATATAIRNICDSPIQHCYNFEWSVNQWLLNEDYLCVCFRFFFLPYFIFLFHFPFPFFLSV